MVEFLGVLQEIFKGALVLIGALIVIGVPLFVIWCVVGVVRSRRRVVVKRVLVALLVLVSLGFGSAATAQEPTWVLVPGHKSTPTVAKVADAPKTIPAYERVVIDGKLWTVPTYINIERFPPLGGKMSPRDAKLLQVYFGPLPDGGWYVNEIRSRRTFEVIWLEKGTMVWMSIGGHDARYLGGCVNRISFLWHDTIEVSQSTPPPPPPPPVTNAQPPMTRGEMAWKVLTLPFRTAWSFWTHPWRGWTPPSQ